jgi:uncharacterized protein (DUF2147 family)
VALAIATCVAAPGTSRAQSGAPAAPEVGLWYNHSGRGAIETYMCGQNLCGRVVWLKQPLTSTGKPMYDGYNPDPAKRSRLICGLTTLYGLKRLQGGGWGGGEAYNPEEGKAYSVDVRLGGKDQLDVTGYVLFFSKTVYWKRAPADLPRCKDELQQAANPGAPPAKPAAAQPAAAAPQKAPPNGAPAGAKAPSAPAAAQPATPPAQGAPKPSSATVAPAPTRPAAAAPAPPPKPATTTTAPAKSSPSTAAPQAAGAAKPAAAAAKANAAPAAPKPVTANGTAPAVSAKPTAATPGTTAPPAPAPARRPAPATAQDATAPMQTAPPY